MQRRIFLQRLAWLMGGFAALKALPVSAAGFRKNSHGLTTVGGRVTAAGKGLKSVIVSDGYTVVATDQTGKYKLDLHPAANTIFVSTPSGYAFPEKSNISRHYHQLAGVTENSSLDFDLKKLKSKDDEHSFIIWADPQVKHAKDVEKMMNQSVPDVRALVDAAGKDALIHGITVGDIVWDEHHLYPDYDKAVGLMGIPFFQCLGNHDMDYNKGGDENSDDTFQATYGPTWYSFNRGSAHYVVLDDVRYIGKDRDYDGYVSEDQLEWLKRDLSFVAADMLIILCLHIPVHSGVKNRDVLYAVLGQRKVHIMSGHTHYHVNSLKGNIYEHNHGTVCGAWWTGPICGDGTPSGYGVYKVKGTELEWYYKSTGAPETHQMKVFIKADAGSESQFLVNIWNHDAAWKTEYFLDNVSKGPLYQFNGFDPEAYATLLGPELPKPRGFAEPRKTDHMFRAPLPAGVKEIKVVATDRFGKQFSVIHTV
ncbi:MAG: calcineurin-like phosphoesterase C-terminal domain-containing protein [Gemmatimonadaceae bacterium]|nr:calcineurin-like phosphoesterase C-terminal domain-containing protein [Chitinophagaceae bacterium]